MGFGCKAQYQGGIKVSEEVLLYYAVKMLSCFRLSPWDALRILLKLKYLLVALT